MHLGVEHPQDRFHIAAREASVSFVNSGYAAHKVFELELAVEYRTVSQQLVINPAKGSYCFPE